MNKPLIKGIFVKSFVTKVRTTLDPQTIKTLEQKFNGLQFSAVKEYEEAMFFKLQDETRQMLYPKLTEQEQWRELGRLACRTFFDNPLGKTYATLSGDNLNAMVKAFPNAMMLLTKNIKTTVVLVNQGCAEVKIENLYQPPEYFEGVFLESLNFLANIQPDISVKQEHFSSDTWTYTYTLTW